MDTQGRDLDSWEEAVEKAVNTEAKTMLQSSSSTREMDSRCPRGNRKKDEKDSGKNKSTDSTSADTSSGKQSSST